MYSSQNAPRSRAYLISIAFVAVLAFIGGVFSDLSSALDNNGVSNLGEADAFAPAGVDFSPLYKAWGVINEKYVPATAADTVSDEDKVWGAVQGLTGSLGDPYTVFLPPVENEIFSEDISGNFEGVGMEIGIRDNVLTVIAPLKGTPAERAGLRSGDRIIEIDDESTEGLTISSAVSKIRGERGTPVVFTVLRDGEDELLEITVLRDVIDIPTIEAELLPENVFLISLYNFSGVSPSLFRDALREFVESGTNKLIIDLRGNPGGFLNASVEMASWFLPLGEVVVTETFTDDDQDKIHRSRGYDIFNDTLRMAVLINAGSASASEILAGALGEHGKATLIGERTFGKGSVQELIDITHETSLKVTIARWVTPNGNSISDGGLVPDIEVTVTEEDISNGDDPQLERAVLHLLQSD
jgi:carboxyl-terminal processing protease